MNPTITFPAAPPGVNAPYEGQSATIDPGISGAYAYQVFRDGVPVPGGSGISSGGTSQYVSTIDDFGHSLTVQVWSLGTPATSDPTADIVGPIVLMARRGMSPPNIDSTGSNVYFSLSGAVTNLVPGLSCGFVVRTPRGDFPLAPVSVNTLAGPFTFAIQGDVVKAGETALLLWTGAGDSVANPSVVMPVAITLINYSIQ